jgi:tRNA A-37 threonylcarbamoyl transferase component Bud32
MSKFVPASGKKCDVWVLGKEIGAGGNADVWTVENVTHEQRAGKFLRDRGKEKLQRFRHEVEAMNANQDIDGVMPVLAHHLPAAGDKQSPSWYVMPLGTPSLDFLREQKPVEIVEQFIELAKTLNALHRRGVVHRDIKPANILALDGRLYLADFGLVKHDKSPDITEKKRDIGPKHFMAPEMRREAHAADGKPADVYSFAKSLWVALTHQGYAFDGQYVAKSGSLSLAEYLKPTYTSKLEDLLEECTDNNPSRRPSMEVVIDSLGEWLEIISNPPKQNLRQWGEVLGRSLPGAAPRRVVWDDLDAIIKVLDNVGNVDGLNHLFYPDRGGNTITSAKLAGEEGFLEFEALGSHVLKPKHLVFEAFGEEAHWNYLWLEAESVGKLDGRPKSQGEFQESVYECGPGEYIDAGEYENRSDRDDDLPDHYKGAKLVSRYHRGAFVIVSTYSPYNQTPATYDARHQTMGEVRFRNYIASSVNIP